MFSFEKELCLISEKTAKLCISFVVLRHLNFVDENYFSRKFLLLGCRPCFLEEKS